MFLMNNMKRGVTWRPLPPDPAPCRSGAERPRVGPRGDEELPEWDARVQVRHERQDRHRQAGQGRGHRRGSQEVRFRRDSGQASAHYHMALMSKKKDFFFFQSCP